MSALDILFVEDEPVVVLAARKVLEPEGLTLVAAGDGEGARESLRQHEYRAVLLDLMIPGVAGMELLEDMTAQHPDLPVIVTTGYATAGKIVAAFKAGGFDFLPKPFDDDELLSVVRRVLRYRDRGGRTVAEAVEVERESGEVRSLGSHSWARLGDDGMATVGVTRAVVESLAGPLRARLPGLGDETVQGVAFAALESPASGSCRIWAPLSGRVVESNPSLDSGCEPVVTDPLGSGWLARVAPWNWQEERNELTVR